MRLFLLIIIFSFISFSQEKDSKLKPGAELEWDFSFLPQIVAKYKGESMKSTDLVKLIKARLDNIDGKALNQRQLKLFVVQFIEDYFQRKISLELAAADGFQPNIGLASLRIEMMEKEQGKEAVRKSLKSSGLPYDEAPKFLAETKALDDWFEKKIVQESQIEEAEALYFYMENRKKFEQPDRIQIAEIFTGFVNSDDVEKARRKIIEASLLLKQGKSFAEVAKKYSEGKQGKDGGVLLRFFSKEELKKELQIVFDMKKGETSNVIEAVDGFHIVKVLAKAEAGVPKFNEIKDQLTQRLAREKAFKLMEARVKNKKIKEGYRIYIE